MSMQYGELGDTFYFWVAVNDTAGSGTDGASAACDVRLAGAASSAAPVHAPTATLLSHANYPAGVYEIAIEATSGNGYATDSTYAVFFTLSADSQNPTGFVGSFALGKLQTAADLGVLLETTVSSVTSQSILVLTDGSTADDAYNGRMITIEDASDIRFIDIVKPADYTGATKTLTLTTPTSTFSAAAGDKVRIYKDFHPELVVTLADLRKILGATIDGTGSEGDPWGPA